MTQEPLATYTGYRTDSAGNVLGYYETYTPPTPTPTVTFTACDPASYPTITVTPAMVSAALIGQAQNALDKSDSVAIRCLKAGVAFPSEWLTYVEALRAIVNSGTGAMPTQPDYPAGT